MDSEKQLRKLVQKAIKQNGKVEGIELARRVYGFVKWDGIPGVKLEKIYAMGMHINGEDVQRGYYKTITHMEKYYDLCDMENFFNDILEYYCMIELEETNDELIEKYIANEMCIELIDW